MMVYLIWIHLFIMISLYATMLPASIYGLCHQANLLPRPQLHGSGRLAYAGSCMQGHAGVKTQRLPSQSERGPPRCGRVLPTHAIARSLPGP